MPNSVAFPVQNNPFSHICELTQIRSVSLKAA